MRPIGFSTGALALGDVRRALAMLEPYPKRVVELSALRARELPGLIAALDELRVEAQYGHVSLHAPSAFEADAERTVVELLERVAPREWPIIVHPGIMRTPELWRQFGPLLCIENMDRRSGIARTCEEVERQFELFPDATLCLDLGHVRQIDSSMVEAYRMLTRIGDRLRQVHLSEVTWGSRHARISFTAKLGFKAIADLIPTDVPIVLESVLEDASQIGPELAAAADALTPDKGHATAAAE